MQVWQPWGGEMATPLGFVAMGFSWVALFLIGRHDKRGWPVGLVGDVFWTAACLDSGILSFIINDITFVVLRIYGWWSWRHK